MHLIDRFHRLHAVAARQPQPGLPALADALHCSERNVRILLRKMEEQGWLRWEAARGRGHFSRLTFLVTPQDASLDHVSGLLERGELEQAFASLDARQRKRLSARLPEFLRMNRADAAGTRLRMPLFRPIESLDPHIVLHRLEAHLVRQIFSRLVEYDGETRRVVPALAHHWECEDAGRVWHFYLRPGIVFHDGAELDCNDVRHTLLRMRDSPSLYQPLFAHLLEIECGPRRRLTCRLKLPDYLWPQRLAISFASITPKRRNADFGRMPVGTGPFKVIRNNQYRVTLAAFADHYRERALLDEIDLWVVPDTGEGEVFDVNFGFSAGPARRPQDIVKVQAGCNYIICNPKQRSLSSVEQRLALADWLAPDLLLAGDEARRPAAGVLPDWKHRVACAPAHSNLPRGMRLRMVTGQTEDILVLGNRIQERLREAGIELEWTRLPYQTMRKREWLQWADIVLTSEVMHEDLEFGCHEWFGMTSIFRAWMPAHYRRMLDARLTAIQAQPDSATRMQGYADIARILVCEGWLIPISHEHQHVDIEPHVGGIRSTPLGFVPFAELWVR